MTGLHSFAQFRRVLFFQFKARTGLREFAYYYHNDKKAFLKKLGMALLIVLSVGSLMPVYWPMLSFMMAGAQSAGLSGVLLTTVFLAAMTIMLVFGVFAMIGTVFSGRDYDFFAALPIRPAVIFTAKFAFAYLYDLLISLFFTIPAVVIYAGSAGADPLLILRAVLILPLIPAIPLAIAALIALIVTRISALSRHRDLMITLLSVLFMVGVILLQTQIGNLAVTLEGDPDAIIGLLADNRALMSLIAKGFPPAAWAAVALTGSGDWLAGLILFVAASAALLALTIAAGGLLYRKGALAGVEARGGGKKGYRTEAVRSQSGITSILMREFKLILRSPVYALNCMVGIIILPLMLFILPVMGASDPEIAMLSDGIRAAPPALSMLILAGGLMLITCTGTAASSTVSREAPYLWIARTIPMPIGKQIFGRFLCGMAINAAGMLITCALAAAVWHMPVLATAGALVLAISVSVSATALSMLPDILRPKLTWASEAEAVKQNINVLFGMLLSFVVSAVFGFTAYLLYPHLAPLPLFLLLEALAAAAGAGALSAVMKTASRRLRFG